MGNKMAGTNEPAFFAVEAYVPGGVQHLAEEEKSKNAFRPVLGSKSTFPVLGASKWQVFW